MASAVEWVDMPENGTGIDVALEEMESQYYLEWMQQEIASMEAQLEDDPSNEELQNILRRLVEKSSSTDIISGS